MNSVNKSKFTAQLLGLALAVVSLLVFTGSVTDPVNVTKLFAIGGFAFALLGSLANNQILKQIKVLKFPLIAVSAFLVFSIIVLFKSEAPFTQSLYGVYGRNNGFILYLSLSLVFIASLSVTERSNFSYVIYALLFSGLTNVVYGLWVMFFGDFISWNNQYGNLLGTFGNPNFIGSFFGMFSSVLFAALFSRTLKRGFRIGALLLLPLVLITIMDTKAVQGKVLFIVAGSISLFFYIRDRLESKYFSIAYVIAAGISLVIALFGTLQKGPLANLLYKETVSLRGEYWYSGWQTGVRNPLFGVGFDSLGDWYRRSRRESALNLPGVDTVTNAAHNVYMDIFAFGGWPLLISYSFISLLVVFSAIKYILKYRRYDFTFVSLFSVWVCYQLQSIISINQIGLAIWGWATAGLLIAYTNLEQFSTAPGLKFNNKKMKNGIEKKNTEIFSSKLLAGIFSIVGMIVSVPPLSADMRWRTAQLSQDVLQIEAILKPSYMNPLNSNKIVDVVRALEMNKFPDLAHKYAKKAIEFNPNSFESWRTLTLLSQSTEQEKREAFAQMKRLDPLNPELKDLSN